MRGYDPRIGRFPSVDPLTKKYPWYSPYQYAGNKPVWKRDVDGLEEEDAEEALKDREELYRRADQMRLREALKDVKPEEDKEEVKDPLKNVGRWREILKNYGRNGFNATQTIFGGATQQGVVNFKDLQETSEAQRAAIGGSRALIKISTPYGPAEQALTKSAFEAVEKVNQGAPLYRIGTLGKSQAGEAQFWSLENPSAYLNKPEEFAAKFGIPAENLKSGEIFIEVGKLQAGASFVTRPAPGVGANGGGAIEVVTEPGSVKLETFSVLKK